MTTYYVYALVDSCQDIYYIGTTTNPTQRLKYHRANSLDLKWRMPYCYLYAYFNMIVPEMKILKEINKADAMDSKKSAYKIESEFISLYTKLGYRLCNDNHRSAEFWVGVDFFEYKNQLSNLSQSVNRYYKWYMPMKSSKRTAQKAEYILRPNIIELIKKDVQLRIKICIQMERSEQAILKSINRTMGKSIAKHYDALNRLIDETGMSTAELRKQVK